MFISKWRSPLAAILKSENRNILINKNLIFMQFASKYAVFQILLNKNPFIFLCSFPFNHIGYGLCPFQFYDVTPYVCIVSLLTSLEIW